MIRVKSNNSCYFKIKHNILFIVRGLLSSSSSGYLHEPNYLNEIAPNSQMYNSYINDTEDVYQNSKGSGFVKELSLQA